MTGTQHYDLIIIGGGPAGQGARSCRIRRATHIGYRARSPRRPCGYYWRRANQDSP